jgi:hypothetical protein
VIKSTHCAIDPLLISALKAEFLLYPERTAAFDELRRSLQNRERRGQKMQKIGIETNSGMKMPSETGS